MPLEGGEHCVQALDELGVVRREALRYVRVRPRRRGEGRRGIAREAGELGRHIHAELVRRVGVREDAVQLRAHIVREVIGRAASAAGRAQERRVDERVQIRPVDLDEVVQVGRRRHEQVVLEALPRMREPLELAKALQLAHKVHHLAQVRVRRAQLEQEGLAERSAVPTARHFLLHTQQLRPCGADARRDALDVPQVVEQELVAGHRGRIEHGVHGRVDAVLERERVPARVARPKLEAARVQAAQDLGVLVLRTRRADRRLERRAQVVLVQRRRRARQTRPERLEERIGKVALREQQIGLERPQVIKEAERPQHARAQLATRERKFGVNRMLEAGHVRVPQLAPVARRRAAFEAALAQEVQTLAGREDLARKVLAQKGRQHIAAQHEAMVPHVGGIHALLGRDDEIVDDVRPLGGRRRAPHEKLAERIVQLAVVQPPRQRMEKRPRHMIQHRRRVPPNERVAGEGVRVYLRHKRAAMRVLAAGHDRAHQAHPHHRLMRAGRETLQRQRPAAVAFHLRVPGTIPRRHELAVCVQLVREKVAQTLCGQVQRGLRLLRLVDVALHALVQLPQLRESVDQRARRRRHHAVLLVKVEAHVHVRRPRSVVGRQLPLVAPPDMRARHALEQVQHIAHELVLRHKRHALPRTQPRQQLRTRDTHVLHVAHTHHSGHVNSRRRRRRSARAPAARTATWPHVEEGGGPGSVKPGS